MFRFFTALGLAAGLLSSFTSPALASLAGSRTTHVEPSTCSLEAGVLQLRSALRHGSPAYQRYARTWLKEAARSLPIHELQALFESEKEYGRAMTDFRRAAALSHRVKAHGELKSEVEGAIRRLGSRVGEVQVGTLVGSHCRRTTFWLDPGTHRLDVGSGRFETVTVRAGQTLDAGGCR